MQTVDGNHELIPIDGATQGNSVLIVVPDRALSREEAANFLRAESHEFKIYVYSGSLPDMFGVNTAAELCLALARKAKIKRATVLGLGLGGSIAQAIANIDSKFLRKLVLVDATTRVAPNRFTRFIDTLERVIPLGLPLRALSKAFDSRPFLHRIRCPVLILRSPDADAFLDTQSQLLSKEIPNSWFVALSRPVRNESGVLDHDLELIIKDFLEVQVKAPQKNLPTNALLKVENEA